ncbi:hypothetical protein [Bordetella petrii]|uniref:Uncharacterized protein n=1 Tax=Bordetella petrii (strain ATCC BAA-461 / DSM 12804 / CCUG 43448 / CIP 107267 / Se-1111R) TaxID=340100 RepID=A9IGL3_BORPD|nr:hypothetical protein [Bordetella petrii]CAP41956.1 hypothetical protein Bpet1617 [Bordetella petrii]
MSTPFNILPGSSAESAVKETRLLRPLRPDNVAEQIMPIMERYGVDSMTRTAVGEAATQLAGDPAHPDASALAEQLVGTAVADPKVAGNQAKNRVLAQPDLPEQQQKDLAVQAAGEEAAKAGGSSSVAQEQAREAMNQGASPAMAAYVGAAAAVSIAVANNSASSGLEIFGHLKALVQGMVIETYLKTENKTVLGKTTWTIGNSLVQTTSDKLSIHCDYYYAEAPTDISELDTSSTRYWGGYYMRSPIPLSMTGASFTGSVNRSSVYYAKMGSAGVVKETLVPLDIYVAAFGTARVAGAEKRNVNLTLDAGIIKLWHVGKAIFS